MRAAVVLILCLVALTSAFPKRENKWRPSTIDLTKYKPVDMTVTPKRNKNYVAIAEEMIKSKYAPTTKAILPKIIRKGDCGKSQVKADPFIVGGTEATPHEFPWQVYIQMDFSYFCGGSVISDEWIMTAAHCVKGFSFFSITLGAHYSNSGGITADSEEELYNDLYDEHDLSNDIALIRVPKITFNDKIQPVCLPSNSEVGTDFVGTKMTVSGWGKYCDSCGISPVLRKVTRPVMSNRECNSVYGIITDGQICLDTTGGKGTCNGDSGGPMGKKDSSDVFTQYGVVSFGASAGCEKDFPVGFTRVTEYLDFISEKTGIVIE